MQEENEQQEIVKIRNKGCDADGYYFSENIHHPCPPNKDKSEYADASLNWVFEVCIPHLFLMFRNFFQNTKYLFEWGK